MLSRISVLMFGLMAVQLCADRTLSVYLVPPSNDVIASVKSELEKLNMATQDALSKLNQKPWSLSGFLVIYGGYFDYSNTDGSVSFPLRHDLPKAYVVITPRVSFVKLNKETMSAIQTDTKEIVTTEPVPLPGDEKLVVPDSPVVPTVPVGQVAKMYLFEKIQDADKNWLWEVSEQVVPADGRLPSIAMIFLSEPRNLFVPVGSFPLSQEDQMLLPPICVIDRFNVAKAITDNIEVTRYLEPIKRKLESISSPKIDRNLVTNY